MATFQPTAGFLSGTAQNASQPEPPGAPISYPKGKPLQAYHIENWRKAGDDSSVANMAYRMDPQFKAVADQYLSRAQDMSPQLQRQLPTLLLNDHYKLRQPKPDDVTARMAAEATQPSQNVFARLGQSLMSVPRRAALSLGNADVRATRQEVSRGFDLADLPGDIADVAGGAIPLATSIIGGVAGTVGGPAGSIAGAAAAGAGGEGTRQMLGELIGVNPIEPKQFAKDVAIEGAISGASEGIGQGLRLGIGAIKGASGKAAQTLYQGSLKPTQAVLREYPDVVKTGMDNRIVLTRDALDNVKGTLDDLGLAVDDAIEEVAKRGPTLSEKQVMELIKAKKPVDPIELAAYPELFKKYSGIKQRVANMSLPDEAINIGELDNVEKARVALLESVGKSARPDDVLIPTQEVLSRMDRARKFFSQVPGGSKYVDQLDELAKTFTQEQGRSIPLEKAQAIKKSTYKLIKDAYGDLSTVHKEGMKDIARGLKEELVTRVPGLKDLNLKSQQLIGLEKALEAFAGRTGNRDILGIAGSMGAGAGAVMGGPGGAVSGAFFGQLAKKMADNPAIKSSLALFLNDFAKSKGVQPGTALLLRGLSQSIAEEAQNLTEDDPKALPPAGGQR